MDKYTAEEIVQKDVWEKLVLSRKPQTFLQSWNWGQVNEELGSKIFRLGFNRNGKLVGICLLIKENAKRGPHFLIPAGPLLNWKDRKLIEFFLKTIRDLASKEKVWFVRVRPELFDTKENESFFRNLGFTPAPMHVHAENTWILDITRPEDEILCGMRKTTRYLVKRGEKSGLVLEISKDPKCSSLIYKLQKETIDRHGFVGFSQDIFESEIETFGKDNEASVFICKKGGKSLAAAIIVFYGGTAYYHFSGSVSGFSKIPFSYFLLWEIIKEAKKRGVKYYNFWGIAPQSKPNHRFAGVTLFKTGFGGYRVDWLHAHDLPISQLYWLTYIFETLRRVFRRL